MIHIECDSCYLSRVTAASSALPSAASSSFWTLCTFKARLSLVIELHLVKCSCCPAHLAFVHCVPTSVLIVETVSRHWGDTVTPLWELLPRRMLESFSLDFSCPEDQVTSQGMGTMPAIPRLYQGYTKAALFCQTALETWESHRQLAWSCSQLSTSFRNPFLGLPVLLLSEMFTHVPCVRVPDRAPRQLQADCSGFSQIP